MRYLMSNECQIWLEKVCLTTTGNQDLDGFVQQQNTLDFLSLGAFGPCGGVQSVWLSQQVTCWEVINVQQNTRLVGFVIP
jgi:hypothetical protein